MRKSRTGFYILRNMRPVQVELAKCLAWWEHCGDAKLIESTPVLMMDGEHVVETIFTGIGPHLFQTYLKPGILKPQHLGSYRTLGEAKNGHRAILDRLFESGSACAVLDDDF